MIKFNRKHKIQNLKRKLENNFPELIAYITLAIKWFTGFASVKRLLKLEIISQKELIQKYDV